MSDKHRNLGDPYEEENIEELHGDIDPDMDAGYDTGYEDEYEEDALEAYGYNQQHMDQAASEDLDDYDDEVQGSGLFGSLVRSKTYLASDEDLELFEEEEKDYEARDYRPIRMRRDSKTGCLGGIMYALFVISVSVVLACVGWMAATDVLALNKEERAAVVTIPEDFTADDVATALKDAGIIEYKLLFKLFYKISNAEEKIKPGNYEQSTRYDYRALISRMAIGTDAQQTTSVTIPEGYTMKQIFETLEANNICSMEDLNEAAANATFTYDFLEDSNIVDGDPLRLEGFLFPDTYEFYQGEQASVSINRFLNAFHYKLTAEMLEKAEEQGRTLREIITIASMIEKEAANDEERKTIASVIYNRLAADMRLDIDATVLYVLPEHKEVLSQKDLATDSPYNTRKYKGLPPGPIANPGMASIQAALNPEKTSYLFYALDTSTGAHKFSKTQAEHDAFVATQDYS